MAKSARSGSTSVLEAFVVAKADELDALLNVLERKRLITKAEVLAEMERLREKAAKAH